MTDTRNAGGIEYESGVSLTDDELAHITDAMEDEDLPAGELASLYAGVLEGMSEQLNPKATLPRSLEMLDKGKRRESVEIAKDILRNLRIKIGEVTLEEGLLKSEADNVRLLDALGIVVDIYKQCLALTRAMDEEIMHSEAIQRASEAANLIAHHALAEALRTAETAGDTAQVESLREKLKRLPARIAQIMARTYAELFDHLESGLDALAARMNSLDSQGAIPEWMGLTNHKLMGQKHAPEESQQREKVNIRMAMDEEFAQQQASRRTARNVERQMQQIQRMGQQSQRQRAKRETQPAPSLGSLLTSEQIAQMRGVMQTTPGAAQVETNAREAVRRQLRDNERQRQARQRQKIIQDNMNRAGRQHDAAHDHDHAHDHTHDPSHHPDHEPPLQPPPGPNTKKHKDIGR